MSSFRLMLLKLIRVFTQDSIMSFNQLLDMGSVESLKLESARQTFLTFPPFSRRTIMPGGVSSSIIL